MSCHDGPYSYAGDMDQSVLDRYRERWVGIDVDGHVLADAGELDELLDTLDANNVVGAVVQRIPGVNEPLFVGLR